MRSFIALLSWLLLANVISAQTIITGFVKDESGVAVSSAIVTVKDAEKTIAYGITKTDGSFKLTFNCDKKELLISVTMMSYAKEERTIKNGTQNIDFVLKEDATQLEEAVVSAPVVTRIGDTLRFNLPALVSQGDQSLEDALKKVPGITVAENGEIRYLGRAISNFYVEGLETLGGSYTLATRNLSAEHVASVEVLNNHHAIKMEKDKISDQVALNIKLKKSALSKPKGNAAVTGGYRSDEALYTIGGFGMLFGEKGQAMVTAITGNIDESSSSTSTTSPLPQLAVNAVGEISSNTPSLSASRYLFMEGGLVSANPTIKISAEKTLSINATYALQKRRNKSSVRSEYFLGDDDYLILTQAYDAASRAHKPGLGINYTLNSDKKYIRNSFDFSGSFADRSLPVDENGIPISQDQKLNSYYIGDEFRYSFKTGKLEWTAETHLKFAKTPTLKLDITSEQGPYNGSQSASSQATKFLQTFNTSYRFGQSTVSLPITFNVDYNTLESDLQRGELSSYNRLKGGSGELRVYPGYTYTTQDKRFKMSVSLALRGVLLKGANESEDNSPLDFRKFYADPNLNMTYTVSPENDLMLIASCSHNYGNITSLLTNPVMHDYRRVSSQPGTLSQSHIISSTFSWRYNNPISLWFGSWSLGYNDMLNNLMSSLYYTGDSSTSSFVNSDNHSQTVSSNAELSKRVSSIKGKFTVRGGWNWSKSGMIQQDMVITYYGTGFNAGADVNLQPVDWMESSLSANWRMTSSRYASVNNAYRNFTGRATITFYPTKTFTIRLNGDYSHLQLSDGSYKDLTLFDAYLSYKIGAFTLSLTANNILDQKHYAYTVVSGLDTHSYDYTLRPRDIYLSLSFTF